jgi:hypothetical protein
MISNPEIQIMEKVNSQIFFEENQYYYEIEGISTFHFDRSVLQIFLKLYSPNFEHDLFIKFYENGNLFLEAKEEFIGKFENQMFSFELVEEEPLIVFKLSAANPKFFEFTKEENKYKLKIKEQHLIKGALEVLYYIYK